MLQNGATVQGRNGILSAKAPAAAQELREAIRLAARDEAMLGKTGLGIRLTGPKAPPIFAHVLPMNGSELRTRLLPVAAVFIGPSMAAASDMAPGETKQKYPSM